MFGTPMRGPSSPVRLALVGATAAAVLGLGLLLQPASQADTAALASDGVAAVAAGDKLVIAVPLTADGGQRLDGKLSVTLVAEGKTVGEAEQEVRQGDRHAAYRFEIVKPKQAADKLTLRCRFG